MIRRASFRVLVLVAFLPALMISGCISSGSVSEYEGPSIGDRTLAQIEPGETSQRWVLAVLGEPTERARIDEAEGGLEVWKWTRRKVITTRGSAVLVSSRSKSEEIRTVYVEFRDGVVTRAWRD